MRLRGELPSLDGATTWLNSRGILKENLIGHKPTLIHFWSVSCQLCKTEMPHINQFRDDYQGKLNIIAVHMPRSKKDLDIEDVKSVAAAHDISQPIYVDNDHTLTDLFSNHQVPAYYVFDTEGKLRHYQSGNSGMKMLTKRINRVLGIRE